MQHDPEGHQRHLPGNPAISSHILVPAVARYMTSGDVDFTGAGESEVSEAARFHFSCRRRNLVKTIRDTRVLDPGTNSDVSETTLPFGVLTTNERTGGSKRGVFSLCASSIRA